MNTTAESAMRLLDALNETPGDALRLQLILSALRTARLEGELAGVGNMKMLIVPASDYATVKGETGLPEDALNKEPYGYDEERT